MSGSLQLYEFSGSVWSNAPKIAIEEGGFKKGQDYDYITINLAEGANFDPSYLKINPAGTVPTLIVGKDTFTDSISAVAEINKLAPNKPKGKVSGGVSLIEEVSVPAHGHIVELTLWSQIHGAAIDPNATLLLATDDKDREVKANGLPKAFLAGRQKALNQFSQSPPAEFKDFLNKKREDNLQLLDFYSGAPDEQTRKAHYAQGQQLWSSVGAALQGFVADALTKNHQGPYVGGSEPSEADCACCLPCGSTPNS
ncbi:hypothetical protein, variant 2 [Cryptococcus amylolentus CBS 6039]|uniref:GST N-terminal domain-containing protein n=1 Tax=Cryptococcus amylolentus CBS 6039 TaxID=1295533 RepID=A0A1E3I2T5_9TREE|nr:hypothetical protein, variant 2 [Cryptococcus amylolentus CBS 6039]ODN82171.1 hypothetical protein, variant 2 [Cryptococcus amylolentus CBS 6039]